LLTLLLAALFAVTALGLLDIILGMRRIAVLGALPSGTAAGDRVSIVVAARDEAGGVERAARSLLAQEYQPLEIILVDDRSSDGTGAIVDRLAREDPRLRVIHVTELPPGWLGKNHALALGAAAASGEWLLFTDADVVLAPGTVARGLGYARDRALDHLTVLPEVRVRGLWLQGFVTGFSVWALVATRPWTIRNPRSRRGLGVGAFNLVRRDAYLRAGGHQAIRLRPDDDLKLGKILRKIGARADVLRGSGAVVVEWYASLREAIDGLMKNSFAVVEYRVLAILAGVLLYLGMGLGPLAGLVLGNTLDRLLAGGALACQVAAAWWMSREIPLPRRSALLFPVTCLLLGWVVIRAMVGTLARGGIRWRGTFYPLRELRQNRV
jgi:hypothetical protein